MGRRRRQFVPIENRPDVLRRVLEIPGELDFSISGRRQLGQRAFEVLSHLVSNGITLQAQWIDLVLGLCGTRPIRSDRNQRACSHASEKRASCHGHRLSYYSVSGARLKPSATKKGTLSTV